ncbi:MAG: zinc ribbon domain-containing protein, partial [Candidatus Subteraquimicrobiales bacterium]|nr:zinc ribbon domain-containing protein [Candidatus Subteraquimicrobiales bacterium]
WVFKFALRLSVLFLIVLYFSLVYWTYRDAKKRGAIALYWAAVVLIFNIFGWLIYLVLRPSEYIEDTKERELEIKTKEALLEKTNLLCLACGSPVENDFLCCPYCRKTLKKSCPNCSRLLLPGWVVCPYCKTSL